MTAPERTRRPAPLQLLWHGGTLAGAAYCIVSRCAAGEWADVFAWAITACFSALFSAFELWPRWGARAKLLIAFAALDRLTPAERDELRQEMMG